MTHYFITGATGAIGSALVPVLLADPQAKCTLLLRAGSADELGARRQSLYRFWQPSVGDTPLHDRLRALRGDVTLPDFGLAVADYQELAGQCTHIIHSAGNVRMNLPIEQARRSSVDSARHIVALAQACARLEKVEFVSTVGVGGRMSGTLPEEWLSSERSFHNTYEQAKAEAEEIVRVEVEGGLPLTVHRPSMVVGESGSGRIIHFQVFYHLCEFLSGRRLSACRRICPAAGSTSSRPTTSRGRSPGQARPEAPAAASSTCVPDRLWHCRSSPCASASEPLLRRRVAVCRGSGTIIACPGGEQPASQQRPGCRLRVIAALIVQHAAVEQPFDQFDLAAERVVAPDLLLHGCRRAAAVQADHRVPAALIRGRQILDEAGDFDALVVGNVGLARSTSARVAAVAGLWSSSGPGQGDDQPPETSCARRCMS
jgi:NAD(P)-dependent dehydrogenase (short-subunit alcohol dehydrogenase family)